MTTNNTAHDGDSFVIPSRTLRGSKRDMVQDIDEAIIGLLALRHLIDGTAPPPEALANRGQRPQSRRRWPRFLSALRPVGFGR
jgi:hypothetical protein